MIDPVPNTPRVRLLSEQELAEAGPPEAIRIPIDLVDPNPRNPRIRLPEVDQLAANVREFGLMQPIFVRRAGDRYEVIAGHRRRAAFLWLHDQEPFVDRWLAIPAVVVSADDDLSELMLISAQAHIAAWKPREQAAALERLAMTGMTLKAIGERLNRTESWASKRLRVFADSVLSGYVQSERMQSGVAEELLRVRDPQQRKALADRAVAETWNQSRARIEANATLRISPTDQLGQRGNELLDLLSGINGRDVPVNVFRDLMILRGRLESLADEARGTPTPRIPTIEAAERAAGVRSQTRPLKRGERRKPGYKPRV